MKKHMRKALSFVLVLGLLFSAVAVSAFIVPSSNVPVLAETESKRSLLPADFDTTVIKKQFREQKAAELSKLRELLADTEYMSEVVRVMIELNAPAAKQSGKSESSVIASQKSVRDAVRKITGSEAINSYGYLVNGFSFMAKRSDFQKIREIPGVKNVSEVPVFETTMFNAPDMTKASQVWEELGFKGEGMLISIIDTGIDYNHKDMRLSPEGEAQAKLSKDAVAGLIAEYGLDGKYFNTKIPYGYNYADKNQEVVDQHLSGRPYDADYVSMHGMHVAGIAAGNATDEDLDARKGIRGVAPEAQLLAMKVFSNHQTGGAYGDDILMAIQDSVKLGADVINMSLGSPSGFSNVNNATARAIQAASEAGTLVVISAGNEGLAYASSPNNMTTNVLGQIIRGADSGAVGASSTIEAALSVASIDNTKAYDTVMSYKVDGDPAVSFHVLEQEEPYDGRTFLDGQWIELVDCGLGDTDEIPDEVAGKYALVKRGVLLFEDKAINVADKGAIGIIVYNNVAGPPDSLMSGVENGGISSVFTSLEAGTAMAAALEEGGVVTVNTAILYDMVDISAVPQPSRFTSWGPTPELNFKPEVAGVGGMVYSTLNGDQYGMMSGTSMSAPHVAGASALIMQAMKDNAALNGIEKLARTQYLKAILSNTATVLMDGEVIHSPRRVGAGLINIKDAVDSLVTVTHNGSGNIELLDFTGSKKFTLDFKNYGAEPVTFTLKDPVVYTAPHKGPDPEKDVVVPTADVTTANTTITVPANGTVSVEFEIDPGDVESNYVEGYLEFETVGAPDLSIPFFGYVGSWGDDLPIFDLVEGMPPIGFSLYNLFIPELDPSAPNLYCVFSATQLYRDDPGIGAPTPAGNWWDWVLGKKPFNPSTVGFNTNPADSEKDYIIQELTPHVGVFRGVQDVECFILDKDGNELRQVGWVDSIRKPVLHRLSRFRATIATLYDTQWDGTLYDKSNGEFFYAEEGQYFYEVRARMNEKSDWQSIYMPVKIDNTIPTGLTLPESVTYEEGATEVKINCGPVGDGAGTGVDLSSSGVLLEKLNDKPRQPAQDIEYDGEGNLIITINVNPKLFTGLTSTIAYIVVADYVGNTVIETLMLNEEGSGADAAKFAQSKDGSDAWRPVKDGFVKYNKLESDTLKMPKGLGYVVALATGAVERVTVNGQDAVDGKPYLYAIEVEDGVPVDLELKGFDADNVEVSTSTGKLLVDLTAPTLALENELKFNSKGRPYVEDTDTVKVKVSDNYAEGRNSVVGFDGEKQFALTVGEDGTVSIPIAADAGFVVLVPVDYAGNRGETMSFFVLPEGKDPEEIAAPMEPIVPNAGDFWIVEPESLKGLFYNGWVFLYMDEEAETHQLTLEGKSKDLNSLTFDGVEVLGADGAWAVTLTLKEGLTYVNVKAVNEDDLVIYDTKIRFFCDSHVPNLVFETDPASVGGYDFVFPEDTHDPEEISGSEAPLVIWTTEETLDENITGTASDNTFGYKLTINGDVVLDYYDITEQGPDINELPFEYLVEGAVDKDFIRLEIEDLSDFNATKTLLQKIQVRLDTTAPTLTPQYTIPAVAGLPVELFDDDTLDVEGDEVVLSAEADDGDGIGIDDAVGIVITLNGAPYDGEPLGPGTYHAEFYVKDKLDHKTTVELDFAVVGDPVINVGPDVEIYAEDVATFKPLQGVTATDPLDGDITDDVTCECDLPEAFAAGVPGTYTFTYSVTNAYGRKVSVERTVKILGKPQIFGAVDTTITQGDEFDPMAGVTAHDNEDGDLTDEIQITGEVDVTKPGVYKLTYTVVDSDGNAVIVVRKVTVKEKVVPPGPDDPDPGDPDDPGPGDPDDPGPDDPEIPGPDDPDPEIPDPGTMKVYAPVAENKENDVDVSGDDRITYTIGKSKGATYRAVADDLGVEDLLYVTVDGKKIVKDKDYTVEAGSILVTLKKEFLDKLKPGKHTVGIYTTKGHSIKILTILATVKPTGESTSWLLYAGGSLVVLSAMLVTALFIIRKRRDEHSG